MKLEEKHEGVHLSAPLEDVAPVNPFKDVAASFPKILGALAGIWLLFEIINYFIPSKPLSAYRYFGLIVFILVGVILGIGGEVIALNRRHRIDLASLARARRELSQPRPDTSVARIQDVGLLLAEALRSAYTKRNWDGVIRLGSALSRPLWITGRYPLRIEIGKLVEEAASFSKKPEIQAAALIDDLGWTSVALGKYQEAIAHIEHGLKIAREAGLHVFVCKGYRHLSGIALKQSKTADAEKHAQMVEDRLATITGDIEHKAMAAGLNYLRGRIAQTKGDYPKALQLIASAKALYVQLDDKDRSLKLMGAIGEIQLASDDLKTAKDTFREGVAAAYDASRGDCLLTNLIGLAKIAQREEQYSNARDLLVQASKTALELGDTNTAHQLEEKARRLPA